MESTKQSTPQYPKVIEGKDPSRVPQHYLKYPNEWIAQYNMLLPDGISCSECANIQRCAGIFGQNTDATSCQFYPTRYYPKTIKDVANG